MTKKCRKCGKEKPISEFYLAKKEVRSKIANPDDPRMWRNKCKECGKGIPERFYRNLVKEKSDKKTIKDIATILNSYPGSGMTTAEVEKAIWSDIIWSGYKNLPVIVTTMPPQTEDANQIYYPPYVENKKQWQSKKFKQWERNIEKIRTWYSYRGFSLRFAMPKTYAAYGVLKHEETDYYPWERGLQRTRKWIEERQECLGKGIAQPFIISDDDPIAEHPSVLIYSRFRRAKTRKVPIGSKMLYFFCLLAIADAEWEGAAYAGFSASSQTETKRGRKGNYRSFNDGYVKNPVRYPKLVTGLQIVLRPMRKFVTDKPGEHEEYYLTEKETLLRGSTTLALAIVQCRFHTVNCCTNRLLKKGMKKRKIKGVWLHEREKLVWDDYENRRLRKPKKLS